MLDRYIGTGFSLISSSVHSVGAESTGHVLIDDMRTCNRSNLSRFRMVLNRIQDWRVTNGTGSVLSRDFQLRIFLSESGYLIFLVQMPKGVE